MVNKKTLAGGIIILLIWAFALPEKGDFTYFFNKRLLDWVQRYPQEKVYLHTDRDHYEVGDKVWFRAYLLNAVAHTPSEWSRYVYVELRDLRDSLYARVKIAPQEGVYAGYLPLTKDLPQGDFVLRAYSYWMQNVGDDFIFRKRIRVINPQDTKVLTEVRMEVEGKDTVAQVRFYNTRQEVYGNVGIRYLLDGKERVRWTDDAGVLRLKFGKADYGKELRVTFDAADPFAFSRYLFLPDPDRDFDVSFMPEGGNLLEGCQQVVAFKAIGNDGLSREVQGVIEDESGEQVTYAQSIHKGMGVFNLTAEPGKKYYGVFHLASDTVEKRFELPQAESDAVALKLFVNTDAVGYKVLGTHTMEKRRDLYIAVHARGIPLLCNPVRVGELGKIWSRELPEGVISFLLLNSEGKILSQRVCFVRHQERPELQVSTGRKRYPIRDTVHVNLAVAGGENRGSFSIAVTDESRVEHDSLQDNIFSYLLLSSDLKGYVEEPAYYFANDRIVTRRFLDMLMMTQGWTRFDVERVLREERDSLPYYMERGQVISGRVKNFWGKEAEYANLMLLGTNGLFRMVEADSAGYFEISGISFPDSTDFILQGTNKRGRKTVEVILDQDKFMPPTLAYPMGKEELEESEDFYKRFMKDYYYDNGIKVYVLDEVVVKRDKPKKFYSFYDAMADYAMDSTQLASMKNLTMRDLFMRFPGVNAFSGDSATRFGRPVKIMVDNFVEEDWDYVMRLRPEELLNISLVIPPRSEFIDRSATGGMIIITTNPFYTPPRHQKLHMLSFSLLGYQQPAEFYMPHYEVDSIRMALADTVDLRNTLYWNPMVETDSTGHAQCFFTTSDSDGPYRVVVEGILQDGTICRTEEKIFIR